VVLGSSGSIDKVNGSAVGVELSCDQVVAVHKHKIGKNDVEKYIFRCDFNVENELKDRNCIQMRAGEI